MKQISHKIISFTMALAVLCSTMSFAFDMHYCGDTLVETAIFHNAKGCGMEMQSPSTEGCTILKENCCNDKQIVVDGQDELQLHVDKISFEQQIFIASFVYTYINLFEGLDKKVSSFKEYRSPIIIKDIFMIDETYLI